MRSRRDEGHEDRPRAFRVIVEKLGMPLDAKHEAAFSFHRLDRLDVSVLRHRRHGKAGSGILHRLMVEAVDAAGTGADKRFEKAPRSDAYGKGGDMSGFLLAVAGYVLVKSASEGDVEQLYPSADTKHRDARVAEKTGELELEAVAVLADLDALAGDLFAVSVRIDVDAAGEEDSVKVTRREEIAGFRLGAREGKSHRQSARRVQGVKI